MSQALLLLTLALAAADDGFRDRVRPVLVESCLACHSGPKPKGGLDLTRAAAATKGGENGPGVVPGKPDESLIVGKVESGEMPPSGALEPSQARAFRDWISAGGRYEGEPLAAAPRRAGPDWWSLRPVARPAVPAGLVGPSVHNPIDMFILERLKIAGISPAPELDKAGLIRRVTFDLIGLPPTPGEVDAFLADGRPDAYERLVDRLLASPHYGERWGRHWLDVVRFGESHGYETNTPRFNAWPYRDYVIRAFNEDTPLPQFALEQFAGDALPGADSLAQSATGFLVGGGHDLVGIATVEGQKQQRADDLDDMITAAGSAFLGLTVNCARCHDHKFDPISQADYYRVQAIFGGVRHADRPIRQPASAAREAEVARLRQALESLDAELDAATPLASPTADRPGRPAVSARRNVERFPSVAARAVRLTVLDASGSEPCIDELEAYSAGDRPTNVALASNGGRPSASSAYQGSDFHKIVHLNDGQVGNGRSWISSTSDAGWARIDFPAPVTIDRVVWGRDRDGQYADRLATGYTLEVETGPGVWRAVASSADRAKPGQTVPDPPTDSPVDALRARRAALSDRLASLSTEFRAYAGTFSDPEPTHRLERGDPMRPAEALAPGAPRAIRPPLELALDAPEKERRLAFARWLGDPANPLPPRVMVNRAWHYHFGRGLVATPSDFGFQGGQPSHPALLDWLADAYITNGYRLKPIHRLIVTSGTYRQSGRADPEGMAVDRDNRLLWHVPPRRLEAELIRDAMLAASGSLDLTMGGPGYNIWEKNTNYVTVFIPRAVLGPDTFRRMVYQFKPKSRHDQTFGAFDCPDGSLVAPRRNASTTALQALNLLNSGFVIDQANRLAGRLRREAGESPAAQAGLAFRLTLGRAPSARESAAATALIASQGLESLARAMFNANEFVYLP